MIFLKKILSLLLVTLLLVGSLAACTNDNSEVDGHIVFADAGWDSIKLHNAVAGLIVEELYDYTWEEIPGSSPVTHEGILSSEIDIHMEEWTMNIPTYNNDIETGSLQELGVNFADNYQGFYVPRYVIEGDSERGIDPIAPDLKTVEDLKNYSHIFTDEDDKNMGRVYGAIPGWDADELMYAKYEHYNLDENYIYFRPGSDVALSAALSNAYERGEAVVGYYWEPTWLMGKYDFVALEEPQANPDNFKEGKSAIPSTDTTIVASNKFYDDEANKEVLEFLSNYKTSSALISTALAHIEDTGDTYKEAAIWFLKENDTLLDDWLNEEDAEIVRASLDRQDTAVAGSIFDFPFVYDVDTEAIDDSVRAFSIKHDGFFNGIRSFLGSAVNGVHSLLSYIPWFVMVLAVILASWKISGKISSGILYGGLLFSIGIVGLWGHMYETLSIVIVSVLISLALGFPIGLLISANERANSIMRPVLDTMQTMPVFVYLIPALLFFGLGNPPAVIATTIYAIVPIIRLTSLGIRQIDQEVVEASMSFGSTWLQSLFKVQIPQALPTIMTGVNQTIMMAMSMVVTTSMIGATGLGMEVLISVNRIEIGRGLISGTAVVIIAVILDRITQGIGRQNEVNNNGE